MEKMSDLEIVKVPLNEIDKILPQVNFGKMPILYLELLENKQKVRGDLINKTYEPQQSPVRKERERDPEPEEKADEEERSREPSEDREPDQEPEESDEVDIQDKLNSVLGEDESSDKREDRI